MLFAADRQKTRESRTGDAASAPGVRGAVRRRRRGFQRRRGQRLRLEQQLLIGRRDVALATRPEQRLLQQRQLFLGAIERRLQRLDLLRWAAMIASFSATSDSKA